jgi:hypothetical protein
VWRGDGERYIYFGSDQVKPGGEGGVLALRGNESRTLNHAPLSSLFEPLYYHSLLQYHNL